MVPGPFHKHFEQIRLFPLNMIKSNGLAKKFDFYKNIQIFLTENGLISIHVSFWLEML
jgi:hypothetical protein